VNILPQKGYVTAALPALPNFRLNWGRIFTFYILPTSVPEGGCSLLEMVRFL